MASDEVDVYERFFGCVEGMARIAAIRRRSPHWHQYENEYGR